MTRWAAPWSVVVPWSRQDRFGDGDRTEDGVVEERRTDCSGSGKRDAFDEATESSRFQDEGKDEDEDEYNCRVFISDGRSCQVVSK